MLVQFHEILDVAFCFNNGQGKHRFWDTDADGVKTANRRVKHGKIFSKKQKASTLILYSGNIKGICNRGTISYYRQKSTINHQQSTIGHTIHPASID